MKGNKKMNNKVPAFDHGKRNIPSLGFLRIKGNKGWDYVFLGVIAGLALLVFLYLVLLLNSTISTIQYSPNDVVYGEEIHAIHSMDSNPNSQYFNFSPTNSTGKSEFRISEHFYDFGEVNSTQVLTRTFIIANMGSSPLLILRAYTTCGCTTADFTAAEVPPGKVILMTLKFDTGFHNMSGTTVRRGVMIETNDPNQPIQEIWIQASVR